MKFYLGTDRGHWLWDEQFRGIPLFVSHRTLRRRVTPFPRAVTEWALDSGGFTELKNHGRWTVTPEDYVAAVRRYSAELGGLDWAAPQDWMAEPWVIAGGIHQGQHYAGTGLSVQAHLELTVENFLTLRDLAPDLPFIPVVQGWELPDYQECVRLYEAAGVDLAAFPVVGIGSVCRRQHTDEIGAVFESLGLAGMHGFGVKSAGVEKYGHHLGSADSMAWSFGGRRAPKTAGCTTRARNCAHCAHYALSWRDRLLAKV